MRAGAAGVQLFQLPRDTGDRGVLDAVCGQLQCGCAFLLRHRGL